MTDVVTFTKRKEEATALLKAGELLKARDAYFSILIDIDNEGTVNKEKIDIKIACLNNLMVLFLKSKQYKEVVELARQVLLIDSTNVKALFRKGQALKELDMNNAALDCVKLLLELEPQNAQAKELLYVIMDRFNPLSDDALPIPPTSSDKATANKGKEGKVYDVSRMPSSGHESESQNSVEQDKVETEQSERLVRGGGWDFMNPDWKPVDNNTSKTIPEKTDTPAHSKMETIHTKEKQEKNMNDETSQMFLDEADRTRIKNQLFAEALQKGNKDNKDTKNRISKNNRKNKSNNEDRNFAVDEIVKKTVEELSLEEKTLVAKVESKKAKSTKKIPDKSKKNQDSCSLTKKKVVSSKAKS